MYLPQNKMEVERMNKTDIFEMPEVKVIRFTSEDVITTSPPTTPLEPFTSNDA